MHSLTQSFLTIVFSTQAFATGCGKSPPVKAGSTANVPITSGGIERDYLLHVPSTYDGKNPVSLIFSFHGRGKDAEGQKKLSQFSSSDYNPDAISVFPNGVPVSTVLPFRKNEWKGAGL